MPSDKRHLGYIFIPPPTELKLIIFNVFFWLFLFITSIYFWHIFKVPSALILIIAVSCASFDSAKELTVAEPTPALLIRMSNLPQ